MVEAPAQAINILMLQVVGDTAVGLLQPIELVYVQPLNPQLFTLYNLMSKKPTSTHQC